MPAPALSDDRFKALSLVEHMPGLGRYVELCIATPMHMSQLCPGEERSEAEIEELRGADPSAVNRTST